MLRSLAWAGLTVVLALPAWAQDAEAVDPLDQRVADCRARADGDCLAGLALFEEAAEAYERFAAERLSDPRAPRALGRAVGLRRSLGQVDQVLADASEFRRRFAAHPRLAEVAAEVFLLGEIYEGVGDDGRAVEHWQRYLRDWGKEGGRDREIVAQVKLAALLMQQSCPILGYHGACVAIARTPWVCPKMPEGLAPSRWRGPPKDLGMREVPVRHSRKPALVRSAMQHLQAVSHLSAGGSVRVLGRDPDERQARRADLSDALAEATILQATEDFEKFLALGGTPKNLDFEQATQWDSPRVARRKKERFEKSSKLYVEWLTMKSDLLERLWDAYGKAIALGGPSGAVAAAAHFSLVTAQFADVFTREGEVMMKCSGPDAHIDAGPWSLEVNAANAFKACVRLAAATGVTSEWSGLCEDEANRRARGTVPPVHEMVLGDAGDRPDREQETEPDRRDRVARILELPRKWKPAEEACPDTATEKTPSVAAVSEEARQDPEAVPRTRPRKDRQDPHVLGVLKMAEGPDLSRFFGHVCAFDDDFPQRLAARYARRPAFGHTGFLRRALGARWKSCGGAAPVTVVVDTVLDKVTSLRLVGASSDSEAACLVQAARTITLPRPQFYEDQATWIIDL